MLQIVVRKKSLAPPGGFLAKTPSAKKVVSETVNMNLTPQQTAEKPTAPPVETDDDDGTFPAEYEEEILAHLDALVKDSKIAPAHLGKYFFT